MAFEAPKFTGILEKASKIALKWGVIFSPKTNTFIGPPHTVEAATVEFTKWKTLQEARKLRETRQTY